MISICTAFYNRRKQFINTLESLKRSSVKDFEVMAVDDASDENQRIDDLPAIFPFLKVFRIESKDKYWNNPCVPFNYAFSKCSGDKIIIQNPEVYHHSDILKLTEEKLTNDNYLSFGVYSLDLESTKRLIDKNLDFKFEPHKTDVNGQNGWYNHSIYRPTGLHFCCAITKKNLKSLNGFDERFAEGNCYDDNEFLHRVKIKKLKIDFIDEGVVLHQYHENFNYKKQNSHQLEQKNANLYQQILKENRYRANPNKSILPLKIVGFAQLRNELSKGNLENWFKQMSVCDYIYIFDQNSDDGSLEYYKKFPNVKVIESPKNRFAEELICKQELLTKLLKEHPDTDWILWLDGDLLLDGRLLANNGEYLHRLCNSAEYQNADCCFFNHYNLWRSDIYYRVDDQYHSLDGNWCPLWRNTGNLHFPTTRGLHHTQYPNGLNGALKTPFCVIHRGFATDYQIINKYDTYKAAGQNGWALDRLLNENGLKTEKLPDGLYPEWFEFTDTVDPKDKERIKNIYENKS